MQKARSEGRLFSRIEWPKDPEIVEFFIHFPLPFSSFDIWFQPANTMKLFLLLKFFVLRSVVEGVSEEVALTSHSKGFSSEHSQKP